MKTCLRAIALAATLLIAACGIFKPAPVKDLPDRPADALFTEASQKLEASKYADAAILFDDVERLHPYSPYATRAQLMAAYAQYQALKYDDALLALDRFIQLHPGHPDIAYAHYLRALCLYERITDIHRDQEITRQAVNALTDIVRRFPETNYARDAQIKIDLAHDHLSGKEMEIGRYYLKRGNYAAAINRFRRVIADYQTTSHVPEALHRLVEANLALGLTEEAAKVAAVLGYNFPGSTWYEDSYRLLVEKGAPPKPKSWVRKTLDSLLD
ncbi:MAG TPA: outer membrane protein assembly factor BamD [Rhodospirillaceae bacterium]|nr:MAG: outer membrane protein assembly factor BamD [Alphaproteobacteria bacterium GWF2_58_20]HAU30010.1 outer membrane protein assembly factor BamD [Rhodospirillaceae bacterium]